MSLRTVCLVVPLLSIVLQASASAQTAGAAKEPPPLWDAQVGASVVATSGNTDTSSWGADFDANRRGLIWQIETSAAAVRATTSGVTTAERYFGAFRANRSLTKIVKFSTGERAERDRFSGIDFRNILDAGLTWALVRRPAWTLDGTTSLAWNHEQRTDGSSINDPVGVLQVLSRIPFGAAGNTTQRFTYYPDFKNTSAYRSEAEVTAQAAMNAHLALKFGWLLRYSNSPVPGFQKTDNTTTASVVLRWKATSPAPQAP